MSLVRDLLLISDGARWISDIAGADYLEAIYQLDWWHYEEVERCPAWRVEATAGSDEPSLGGVRGRSIAIC